MRIALPLALVVCGCATTSRATALDDELRQLLKTRGVTRAAIVVVDRRDGSVAASGGREGKKDAPALATTWQVDPGSVMKTFTVAAALERQAITPADRFSGTFRNFHDATVHGEMSLEDVMAFSSNVGVAQVADRAGLPAVQALYDAVGLPTEVPLTSMPPDEALRVTVGGPLHLTPVQLAQAFAKLMAPTPTVISPATQQQLLTLLEKTVTRDDGTGFRARVPGRRIAGKTGTWTEDDHRQFGAFVGFEVGTPWVVLVVVESTRGDYGGGTISAPSFARLLPRLKP